MDDSEKIEKLQRKIQHEYEATKQLDNRMAQGKQYASKENPLLENNFKYHSPKEGQPEKYTALRDKAKELAYLIDELCPQSREKSVALTELETAIMWANASIARN